ncbi:unnamed protein product [Oikopleura dioica]|uniref:GDP-D-glucose phosphorylase 1 n=1 Tax=Oikopleura dioica TaxID=34765 RepID=E4YS56_OIKDI|nr:unnamed protein product [Oikopleura dioica]
MILAFETFFLVGKKHFRMMYNSLLGWASVNHLHFHCYAFNHELVLDKLKLTLLAGDVFKTDPKYPLPAFVIKFDKENIEKVAEKVAAITDILHELDVAHNMVITSGRCYIFPRKHADTSIVSQCVDPACVELSGQFPCKAEEEWTKMTAAKAVEMIASVRIESDLFARVEKAILEFSLQHGALLYSAEDFVTERVEFGLERLSVFDRRVIDAFDAADKASVLRYSQEKGCNPIREVATSKGLTMVAEFNHHRGFNKRARVEVPTINQPFDAAKFHFNKIAPKEVLFRFRSSGKGLLAGKRGIEAHHLAIVNISPINWCHCLYVIEPEKCLPQRITMEAVRVGFDLMRMTRAQGFRVMFNSLWAWASVNHLHLHSMCVDKPFGMDTCPSLSWGSSEPVRKLADCAHLPGYVFNLPNETSASREEQEERLEEIVQLFEKAVSFFHEHEIPYNCTWAHGSDKGMKSDAPLIRLFLWPRASAAGWEPHPAFDNACAELEGFLPIKVKEEFDSLTGDSAEALIHRARLDEKTTVLVEEFMKSI